MTSTAKPLLRTVLRNLALTACYAASGMIGLRLAATGGGYAAPIWLPSGFAVAAILLYGEEMLPGIWFGAFITNFFVRPELTLENFALSAVIASGNAGEAVAVRLLLRSVRDSSSFLKLPDVMRFIRAAMIGPIVSATVGVVGVSVVHPIPRFGAAASAWITWWIGDSLGAIVLSPLLIALLSEKPRQQVMALRKGQLFFVLSIFAVTFVAFKLFLPRETTNVFVWLVLYTVVIWSTFVLPVRRLFSVTVLVCCLAIWRAYEGLGLFGTGDIVVRLSLLQFFLGCISIVVMVMNAVVAERFSSDELAHQREKALMRAEKMSALGEMASGIAHEIGNPLMVIYARIEEALTMVKEGPSNPAALTAILEKIDAMAERIDQIVRSIRFFSRNPERDPYHAHSLKGIVEDTLELCREQFRRHGVSLDVAPINDKLTIECKPVLIAQVLLNLLNNARDAVQEGPDKWVSVSFRQVAEESEISHVEVAVEDSGNGILTELREEIFRPFFTTKVTGRGIGLGLSVSRNIVESHHGEIFLDDTCPNTRFVVRLPLHQSRATVAEEEAESVQVPPNSFS